MYTSSLRSMGGSWDVAIYCNGMENLQGKSINFDTFTWKIENFTKQKTRNLRSKAFRIGDHKWRIRLYPLRKDVNHFSLYLTVADSLPAYGWTRNTHFKLILINQVDGNKSIVKETQQKFNGGYRSWGSSFLDLIDFYDPKQGYLVNNTCIIEAHVCVSDIPLNTIQSKSSNKINSNTPSVDSKPDVQTESSEQEDDQETESSCESDTLSFATWGSSRTEREAQGPDWTLKDVLDLEKLAAEEAAFVPLLEEACTWHPSLIRSQLNRSERFKLWAFTSLGLVLHFLKTTKVKDMNKDGCNHLQVSWEELVKSSGFDLTWLEPYVQSALGLKAHLERTAEVNRLRDNVVAMEIKMQKLRGELAATEAECEVARRAFAEARKGLVELDMHAELGYSMF